jgi:hypothetical protein
MKLSVVVEQDGKSKTICTWECEPCVPTGEVKDVTEEECAGRVDWILAEGGGTQGDLIREHFGVEE